MYDESKRMERRETSGKTKRVKSVCSLNNTSLGLQRLTKQSRKFHRVIVEHSAEENNLLSLGVCNPYHGKGNVRTQLFNDSGPRRHKSLHDETGMYFINLSFSKVEKVRLSGLIRAVNQVFCWPTENCNLPNVSALPQRPGFGEGQAERSSSDALQQCKHTTPSQWPVPNPRHQITPLPGHSTSMQVLVVRHAISGLHFRHLLCVGSKQREGTGKVKNLTLCCKCPSLS